MENYGAREGSVHFASLLQAGKNILAAWAHPLWGGLLAGVIYALAALKHGSLFGISEFPYYAYLADAFLHGQLALRLTPPTFHDLVFFAGQIYLYWPPLPAVLMMPLVAIFGVNFSDIALTVLVGALNIALVAVLLREANRRGMTALSPAQRGALVLFAAFGTVLFVLAPRGRVWFTGQLIGNLFVLLAYIAALRWQGWKAFFFTGLALGAALLTRNTLVFTGIWPAYFLIKEHWQPARLKRLSGLALAGLGPVMAALVLLVAYNWARFGNPVDFGLDYHRMSLHFAAEYQQYGAFSLHYLPTNFYYNYLYYPFPINLERSFQGGSLFLLSPLFFAAVWAFTYPRQRLSAAFLLLTIIALNLPILLLMGTGWVTFGPRYTLDFIVPLLLLTATGLPRWPGLVSGLAIFISVAHYLFGALVDLP
jgi:hypothetical protein